MAAGALFLSANIPPTEEVELIALSMAPWHTLALVAVSLLLMHAFVYTLEFKRAASPRCGRHALARVHPFAVFCLSSRLRSAVPALCRLVLVHSSSTLELNDGAASA